MRLHLPFLIVGLLLSPGLYAAPEPTSKSKLDVFYARSDFSVDGTSGSVKGSGVGLRGWIGRSWPIVTIEYTKSNVDGDISGVAQDGDVKSLRGGLGVRLFETPAAGIWARAEYLTLDVGLNDAPVLDDDGFAVHLGGHAGSGEFDGYGEVGALKTQDAKGIEGRLGVGYQPANWGLFLEYRLTKLDLDDSASDIRLGDGRVGVRWVF